MYMTLNSNWNIYSFVKGEDVLIKSSQLVHSGEVVKLSKGKTQDVTLFLFDHQLVYCRKVE